MKLGRTLLALCLAVHLSLATAFSASVYEEGFTPIQVDGLWGFANAYGTVAVSPQYLQVEGFQLGTALVETQEGFGVIRSDGIALIQPGYDSLTSIGYGLYIAQDGDIWGVLSQVPFDATADGLYTQILYPFQYDSIKLETTGGLSVLSFTQSGSKTMVSLSSIGQILVFKQVSSAQFPLTLGLSPNFSDVSGSDWYDLWVDIAYNLGLMAGTGGNAFSPNATLSVAEALKLAAFMESRSTGDDFHLQATTGNPWYRTCLTYCTASGIISSGDFDDYERPITRAEMAQLFANTSLGKSLPVINNLTRVKNTLPDVNVWDTNATAIYHLYSAGILAGSDSNFTFRPDASLTRAEAAAIVSRMARAEQRIVLWSLPSLPGYS